MSSSGITAESLRRAVSTPPTTFVYSFGCDPRAGFGADYLGFVAKLIWCLQHRVGFRFCEVRRPMGFVTRHGWTDYFEPFCDTARGPLLDRINVHAFPYARRLPFIKALAGAWLRTTVQPPAHYFSFDDIASVAAGDKSEFDFADYVADRRALIGVLWRYNPETAAEVARIKMLAQPAVDYFAICIRRGDKLMEHGYVDVERYAERIAARAGPLRTVFLATDDASVIEQLRAALPAFTILSLTEAAATGYVHKDFRSLPAAARRAQTVRFFAQLELMRDAAFFIGSRTTNVSWMVNALRGGDGVEWVD